MKIYRHLKEDEEIQEGDEYTFQDKSCKWQQEHAGYCGNTVAQMRKRFPGLKQYRYRRQVKHAVRFQKQEPQFGEP